MDVHHVYVPMRRKRDDMRGFSESELKRRLEKQGWTIWRGGNLGITRRDEIYPNVKRKYELLNALLEQEFPGQLELLQYICAVHHGMPDYLCYRKDTREWKFVECKLIYEQLSDRQKICIAKLQGMGFPVEVHKLIDHRTKTRRAGVDLSTGQKRILEKQLRLPRRTRKIRL
jgi:hypothetical protein